MSIISFIKDQKTHVIYGLLIVGLVAVGYNLLSSKPREITKTITQTKVVNRDVVRTQKQYVDRVIVKTEKNGETTTTTEHVVTDGSSIDKSKSQSLFTKSTQISYLSRYSLDIQYPIPLAMVPNIRSVVFNPTSLIVTGGYRLFNSPIFVTLGANIGFDTLLIGVRYEW